MVIFLILLSGLSFIGLSQNAGDLDSTFGINGKLTTTLGTGDDFGWAVAVQNDGKIIVGGFSQADFALVRYKQDGSLDYSFGNAGKVITNIGPGSVILSLKIQTDGKIVGAGWTMPTSNQYAFALARYNPDGSLDISFGDSGKVITSFGMGLNYGRALAIQPDGKLLVTGEYGGWPCDYSIARYNTNGSLDNSFGNGGIVITNMGPGLNLPKAITVQNDNKIIVVGHAEPNMGIVRYNMDGTLDSTFGTGGKVFTSLGTDSYQTAVIMQPDNKILVAGNYSNGGAYHNAVFRYITDGDLDNSFGTSGITTAPTVYSDYPSSMILQENGDIVIAGTSYLFAYLYFELMKFDGNGIIVNSFGQQGMVQTEFNHYDRCNGLALQNDGKLVAAGYTDYNYGDQMFAVARYIGDIPLSLDRRKNNTIVLYPNPADDKINLEISALAGIADLSIFNPLGQMLIEYQIKDKKTQIDISSLHSGVYFISFINGKKIEFEKIIKN